MFSGPRNPFLACLMTILVVIGSAGASEAAWVTVKNDTNRVIVVQSAVGINGQMRRGKPMRLLPGESIREFLQPQTIGLEVYDAQMPNKPVLTTNLTIKNENQAFSISAGNGGVIVSPVPAK